MVQLGKIEETAEERMTSEALQGQVALVTGGSRGIGSAISKHLAAAGATVVVNYARNSAAAETVAAEISAQGGKAQALLFDVSSEEAVDLGFSEILKTHGRLDILVNNAGVAVDGLLMRTKLADWERTLQVNLTSCFLCSRAATKPMLKAKGGRIINISSVIGEMGNAGQVAYSASKSGIFGLTKSLARELGSRGVTVNAITPGYIVTDMTAQMSEEQTKAILSAVPLGRLGQAQDVAELVYFLASPAASYITGQVIGVNGGMNMP